MQITDNASMIEFCAEVNSNPDSFYVSSYPTEDRNIAEWNGRNNQAMDDGLINRGSHLQQGIIGITYNEGTVIVTERPLLFPSPKLIAAHPEYTGTTTGNLANCFDPENKLLLFQIRGKGVDKPWGFQAAAAGMSVYGQNPKTTATLEMQQETGLQHFRDYRGGMAIDILPFMKGEAPQPLFSYGFLDDLSGFPVIESLRQLTRFEESLKLTQDAEYLKSREGYHFAVPARYVGHIIDSLSGCSGKSGTNRFHGPIFHSVSNFRKVLDIDGLLE